MITLLYHAILLGGIVLVALGEPLKGIASYVLVIALIQLDGYES